MAYTLDSNIIIFCLRGKSAMSDAVFWCQI